jgi:transcriptional regulator with GAF, ATPase, and Fis domain
MLIQGGHDHPSGPHLLEGSRHPVNVEWAIAQEAEEDGEGLPTQGESIVVHLGLPWAEAKRRLERRYFSMLLERHHGNVAGVARAAGLDPANLRRVLRRHGLAPSAYRPGVAR